MMKSPVANWHFVKWLAQRYDGEHRSITACNSRLTHCIQTVEFQLAVKFVSRSCQQQWMPSHQSLPLQPKSPSLQRCWGREGPQCVAYVLQVPFVLHFPCRLPLCEAVSWWHMDRFLTSQFLLQGGSLCLGMTLQLSARKLPMVGAPAQVLLQVSKPASAQLLQAQQ